MERAVRRVTVERGSDPRRCTLVAFGGAGPLHACELAEGLGISRVLVPRWPGVLSALGMLVADVVRDATHALMRPAGGLSWLDLREHFAPLEFRLADDLRADGVAPSAITMQHALDMRYTGQSFELTVPVEPDSDFLAAFHALHGRRYGYAHPDEGVEIVAVRVTASGRTPKPSLEPATAGGPDASLARVGTRPVWLRREPGAAAEPVETPLYERERLRPGNIIPGPAVIFQFDATSALPPGWTARVDGYRNLVIERAA
jgi:N-methylhydantoinase A